MDIIIVRQIALEAARNSRASAAEWTPRLIRRFQRKYKIKLAAGEVASLFEHYQRVYADAGSLMKDHLKPARSDYASFDDLDWEAYVARLVQAFPQEDREILVDLGNWAFQYEYLR